MQAVRLHAKGDLRVEEIDVPAAPGPGEAPAGPNERH